MQAEFYYTAPTDAIFDEVKEQAMILWREVDHDKDLKNVEDNVMYIVAMFSSNNHVLLADKLSEETREAIRLRMIDGGSLIFLIPF